MNLWLIIQVARKVKPIQAKEIDGFAYYFAAYSIFIFAFAFFIWHFILR